MVEGTDNVLMPPACEQNMYLEQEGKPPQINFLSAYFFITLT